MNANYPTSTSDYDSVFLQQLLSAVFKKADLKQCGETEKINKLDRSKLNFARGTYKSLHASSEVYFFQFFNGFYCIFGYF